ncbi:GDSL-like lipase/acylhydrolase family protein [Fadolivirus algeromassiliense]|jgi:lysophospholipase L1-like esterase|uniref:GDSL-like lipase/acylhydrolase family protein n=1 Tax=Fadolivirus FV1/VV64 TaxID=3070911 RepID=A0A7D3V796_9VIRU|nr:GDSL-like lipase/acylhydrolase family protein [Fadolivirus algeromassiliense]QKF93536.1 GDSL-like lipase/acylhydrolase family protein [Fadolivirus FV1/VV64]
MSTQTKQNNLLTPKWKERTYNTHKKHLEQYTGKQFNVAFLGDSMMERWLSTGNKFWDESFKNYANLGVGGDGVEHLLYRLTENNEFKGILDVINVDKIVFMIGTNNLEKKTVNDILEGIISVINIIFKKQPNCKLIVYGLLDRSDIPKMNISELNYKLEDYIKKQNNNKLTYRFFGNMVNNDNKFFVDHVHLSQDGYEQWYNDIKKALE